MQTLSQTESFNTIVHLPAVALVIYYFTELGRKGDPPIYEPKFRIVAPIPLTRPNSHSLTQSVPYEGIELLGQLKKHLLKM